MVRKVSVEMAFDVKKHLIKVQGGKEYLPVASRLVWFRQEHPDWGIETRPVAIDVDKGYAIFEALVYNAEGRLMAKGTKMETSNGFSDYVEKAETGSIGRALAVCGFGTQFAPELDEGQRIVDSPLPIGEPLLAGAKSGSTGKEPEQFYCTTEGCGREITKGQATYSTKVFGRPMCPACQREAATSK
ncbi:MAG: hypothetical protein QHH26_11020 [Armatimonadota bacterium]|nr:hypothetical protein [Armatimonadota bacterium]